MVYLFLANGFETIEALAVVDMLRRAKIDVKTVGVTGKIVASSHNIDVTADIEIDEFDVKNADAVVLPGGMPGTLNLEADKTVQGAVDYCVENKKYICAICAAPSILGHKGLLKGKEAICFPGFENDLTGAILSDKYVVTDGLIITARGAGVAVDFGLEIVKALKGEETAENVRKTIQCR
jgi:4-methyl-5(b-hydroxyethyl)-thiazole monophosphate biosynthesis